jgi:N-acetylneuraminate synthase
MKKSIYNLIKEMELPYDWIKKLKKYCDNKNIIFLCTPFDEESVDQLEDIDIPAYKIASYTISHIPLIRYIAKKNKPIIMSTGASNLKDISNAINVIKKCGNHDFALMQCTAKYPAPLNTINLRIIPTLIKKFSCPIGLSDHSREPIIAPLGAVALGANLIEKHFTTDNNLTGPDHKFAILPRELSLLVDSVRMMEKALGGYEKIIQLEEKELYQFCRRSIYAIKDIKPDETFNKNNIAILRSGAKKRGLEPKYYTSIIGKKASKEIRDGEPINEKCVSKRK